MSRTYGRCKACHRSKSDVQLSSRGLCPACAIGKVMANVGSAIAAAQIANDRAAAVVPLQTAFASQESRFAD